MSETLAEAMKASANPDGHFPDYGKYHYHGRCLVQNRQSWAAALKWALAWLKEEEGGLCFPKIEQRAREAGLLPEEAQK